MKGTRRPILPNRYHCMGCMTCGDACPNSCITFELMRDGHYMPKIDRERCVRCLRCEKVCPAIHSEKNKSTESSPFASWTKDKKLLKRSSSGGTFAQIASEFILRGGYVAGATITGVDVNHILINDINELHKLQGSKYIQSVTTGIFNAVLCKLKERKNVLFSGTPCQVAGLYNFLPQKLWANLYTIDLICHGVPSRNDLKMYLEHHDTKISQIASFRDKTWKFGYAMTLIDEAGNKVQDDNNYFYDSFNSNKTLRWSCYNCPFKDGLQRQSDITIGDFWGAKRFDEQKSKGLSLTIIHSQKGKKLFESSDIYKEEIRWEECLPKNKDYFNRRNFFKYNPLRLLYPKLIKSCDFKTIKALYGKPEGKVKLIFKPLIFFDKIVYYIDYRYKISVVKSMLCQIKRLGL